MKARPILFQPEMVRALLGGRKSQTRRVVKPQPRSVGDNFSTQQHRWPMVRRHNEECWKPIACPYGQPGDLLWVRETLDMDHPTAAVYLADGRPLEGEYRLKWHDGPSVKFQNRGHKKIASIHMPRWANRLTLRITDVRVQRVQEISTDDALAEGIDRTWPDGTSSLALMAQNIAKSAFRDLWNSLHGPDAWEANPWVWALTFDVIRANVNDVMKQADGGEG